MDKVIRSTGGSTYQLKDTVKHAIALLRVLSGQTHAPRTAVISSVLLGVLGLLLRHRLTVWTRSHEHTRLLDAHDFGQAVIGLPGGGEFDVVIIGGGTAGCVLASRLSEDPKIRVLLLEAGKSAVKNPSSHVPSLYHRFFHSKYDYDFYTVPQEHAKDKAKFWPRGKMLGGCSSMNAMIFHHGAPSDFDEWVELQRGEDGASEWAYEKIKPYFLKFENFHLSKDYPLVDVSLRGSGGPMTVGYFGYTSNSTKLFLQACHNAGIANVPDLNTPKGTLGSSKFIVTFIDSRGHRVTTESAYLTPSVLARPNLTIVTNAKVSQIIFDSPVGVAPRAVGAQFLDRDGNMFHVKARKEVVVSAGAIHTPQILMLSGIGPAPHLAEHNIPVICDLPGVGAHLMDHPVVDFNFMDGSKSVLSRLSESSHTLWDLPYIANILLQFHVLGTGPLTSNVAEAAAFARSDDPILFAPHTITSAVPEDAASGPNAPDIELFCSPAAYESHGPFPRKGHHVGVHTVLLRPTSKGTVRLQSSQLSDPPILDPQYLSTTHDIAVLVRAARLVSRITCTEPFFSLLDPAGNKPDSLLNHTLHTQSDLEIEQIVRARVETLYHPACTARMAPRAEGGVVDPRLRVYGVEGLRVVDASIFPTITSGHTVSPTIAVAEKAADMIKETIACSR